MSENTESIQDYLKLIYKLTQDGQPASTSILARHLGITPASVTGMLKRLSTQDPPLVIYQKRRGATLSPQGRQIALAVIRRHRLLETYLVEKLGYGWDEVHEEACRLEHAISARLEARIAAALGNPQQDPHGAPIPRADLSLPKSSSRPLCSLSAGEQARIAHVSDSDPALLRYLDNHALRPGAQLTVLQRNELDDTLTIQVNETSLTLGLRITRQIFVETPGKVTP